MAPTPEERAAQLIRNIGSGAQTLPSDELLRAITLAIREAAAEERKGLRDMLRLCVAAFDEGLTLENIPRPFRAVVRVCRALCLESLQEGALANEAADSAGLPCQGPHREIHSCDIATARPVPVQGPSE